MERFTRPALNNPTLFELDYKWEPPSINRAIKEETFESDAINKLGQLEDIEEELGIDLITLFKVFSGKDIFIKESYTGEIINRGSFYPNIRYKEIHDGYSWHLKFEDYGKTWALTKEELQ